MKPVMIGIGLVGALIFIPVSMRVIDVVKRDHHVKTGFVCRSENDIVCVDDVCNKPGVSYWSIQVNGDYKHYNSESIINPSDKVELRYLPTEAFLEER